MSKTIVIISGYFNPLHCGHLDYIEQGKSAGDELIVVVNNDEQQMLKKGKIINKLDDRMRVVAALRDVDRVVASVDTDAPIINTLKSLFAEIRQSNPDARIIFGNGGADRSKPEEVPEYDVCNEYDVEMTFDMGGVNKYDSSTRINRELGVDD